MRLLILGGTAWLGHHVAMAALEAGHAVSCLARGSSGSVPSGATLIQADRDADDAYAAVQADTWDAVIDVSRQPGQVRRAAQALQARCVSFILVSTVSVYQDHSQPGADESAALLPALEGDTMVDMAAYGSAKVACEQHARAIFGAQRTLIARAGLIGGPGDLSDRTGYWPWRLARAAELSRAVLVPDTPQAATQVIDVRDLAQWLVRCAVQRTVGVFNATGESLRFEQFIDAARQAAASPCRTVTAHSDWLLEQGVSPWAGTRSLPLWIPMASHAGLGARDSSRAVAAGLVRRPILDTLRDTLAWEQARQPPPSPRRAGLSDDDEAALLGALGTGTTGPSGLS